ncbi:lipoteichoic acid stability factor AuxA [Salinicoccus sp. HZC-1]|uniref:lipoteichoic acid stability factor AuxA n=1 Tax=Salinicoccus sp. HZC-1 TaxID=3385497 RepID=UPI00398AF8D7
MKKLKQQSEVFISGILGLFFFVLGIFVLFNTGHIRGESPEVDEAQIETVFDLINAFFLEGTTVLSILIGEFPIIAGILIIIFGLVMLKIAHTIKRTTEYDTGLSFFFISLSFFLFIITTVLMHQVYGWFALFYLLAFIVHMLYNIFNEYLDPAHRKEQYMIILFFYGIAYFFTQNAVYSNIDTMTPTDVLAINTFFVVIWVLSLLALGVGVFLSKSKNLLKKPKREENAALSRKNKRQKLDPNQYLGFSKYLYDFRNNVLAKTKQFMEFEFPKWLKANYVELLLGSIVLIFILIEFNNRHGVFTEGYFRLSQMKYIYEWVNLFLSLALAVAYLFFTFFNMTQNKFYHRQMIIITLLWLKLTVSLYITLFQDVELSLFILPFNVLLVLVSTPLLLISIFKEFDEVRK